MPYHFFDCSILAFELLNELNKACFLLGGAGVFDHLSIGVAGIKAANVRYSDRPGIVAGGMAAYFANRATHFDCSVKVY